MEVSNQEHIDACVYCADQDILCSFADGIFDMHQDPCVRLFMVAFLHNVQRTARKHIFPLGDIDTLVFGTPDAIYLLR